MKRAFVDTGAWIALADRNDSLHKQALQIADSLKSQNILLITSDYVLDEAYDITAGFIIL